MSCELDADCTSGSCVSSICESISSVEYGFEGTVEGWVNKGTPTVATSASTAQHHGGTASLAVQISGSGEPTVSVSPPVSPPAGATVSMWVYVPVGTPVVALAPYVLDASWAWTDGHTTTVSSGAWQELVVTVPSGASLPLNRIGLKTYLGSSYSGAIYIDDVTW